MPITITAPETAPQTCPFLEMPPPKPEAIISAVVKVIEGLRSGALVPRCLQEDAGMLEEAPTAAADTA